MGTWSLLFGASLAASVLLNLSAPQYTVAGSYPWTALTIWSILMVILLFYQMYIYTYLLSPLRHLPMPAGTQFPFGHVKRIFRDPPGEPQRAWFNEVPNDGLIRYLHLFNKERVFVTSTKALSEVLVTKNYDFVKPTMMNQGLGRILGWGILLAEGDEHKRQRRDLSPAFAFRHVKDLYPVFWEKSVELIDRMCLDIKGPAPQADRPANVVSVGDYSSRATLDIIGTAALGQDFDAIKNPSNELFLTYSTIFNPPGYAKWLTFVSFIIPNWIISNLPFSHNLSVSAGVVYVRTTLRKVVDDKWKSMQNKEHVGTDILATALESGGFTNENLVDQMMTFLAAGHETTSTALIWAIYALCKDPSMQQRLRKEIHDNLASPRTPEGRTITSIQIDSLPYLNAVCNEVLRLYTPVRITMRQADNDTSILGQFIPKGTTIVLSPQATNQDYSSWGATAAEFRPERWMNEDGQLNKNGGAESNYSNLTFLHGPRSCIGERFARGEFAALLAAWIGRFESEFETPGFEPVATGGVTAKPKGGLWVRLKEIEDW